MIKELGKLALCVVFLGGAASAQEIETEMELAISDGVGEDVVIRVDSNEQGFNLHEMQLGESHALNTVDGRPVVVTRVEDGYQFDVDGRQISMPLMEHEGAGEHHKEIHIVQRMESGAGGDPEGVTIISATPLDDATRASITATLAAAGENDVRFINIDRIVRGTHGVHMSSPPGEGEEVRIIRKEVRVTN